MGDKMPAVALSIKEIAGAGTQTGKKYLYNLNIQKGGSRERVSKVKHQRRPYWGPTCTKEDAPKAANFLVTQTKVYSERWVQRVIDQVAGPGLDLYLCSETFLT